MLRKHFGFGFQGTGMVLLGVAEFCISDLGCTFEVSGRGSDVQD